MNHLNKFCKLMHYQLCYITYNKRIGRDSNPRYNNCTLVFKTKTLNHSATYPQNYRWRDLNPQNLKPKFNMYTIPSHRLNIQEWQDSNLRSLESKSSPLNHLDTLFTKLYTKEKGFEPPSSVLKTEILPLNYSLLKLAVTGFEPVLMPWKGTVLPLDETALKRLLPQWDLNPRPPD